MHRPNGWPSARMRVASAVEDREYRPFSHIRDGYPRYLFTLDPLLQEREGVRHLNMADFMAGEGGLLVG